MTELLVSTLSVPDCPKSITRRIHINSKTFRPTKVYYSFFCQEGKRQVELTPHRYSEITATGCSGCPYKLADTNE